MLPFASLTVAYLGFAGLALSMPRHFAQLRGGKPGAAAQQAFRALGWTGLALSLWPSIAFWGPSIGITAWLGLLTVTALMLGLVLTALENGSPRTLAAAPALAGMALTLGAGLTG